MRAPLLALLAGALAFGAGVVARWPARAVAPVLPDGIACSQLGGTLWSGHCTGLSAGGHVLGNLRWRLRPASLLRGRLSASVQFDTAGGRVAGDVSAYPGGRLEAGAVAADLDLRRAQLPGVPPDLHGRVVAELPSIGWSRGALTRMTGRIEAADLVRGDRNPMRLGGFEMILDPPAEGRPPSARVQDLGGPLWVRATLAWVPPAGYLLEGEVQARAGASEALQRELERLGPADGQGRRRFAQEASF
jgi:general secretion pathway protein N